jgi:hypothetical protein
MKRGGKYFKQIGKFAVAMNRSSDGKWEKDGKILGWLKIFPFRRGDGDHTDKWIISVILGEYCFSFGGKR